MLENVMKYTEGMNLTEWFDSHPPGSHVFLICKNGEEHRGEIDLRRSGFEIRDCIRWFHQRTHLSVVMGRKPIEGTVAQNVLTYGVGGLNIDGCRVGTFQNTTPSGVDRRNAVLCEQGYRPAKYEMGSKIPETPPGRWPANLMHDGGCDDLFPYSEGMSGGGIRKAVSDILPSIQIKGFSDNEHLYRGDKGSASRFFKEVSTFDDLVAYLKKLVTPPDAY